MQCQYKVSGVSSRKDFLVVMMTIPNDEGPANRLGVSRLWNGISKDLPKGLWDLQKGSWEA